MTESSPVRTLVFRVVVVGLVLAVAWFFVRPPVVEVAVGDVVIVKHSRPSLGGGDDALVSGPLSIGDGGCLGLDGRMTVFPFWTQIVDTDPVTVRVFGDDKGLGEIVEGGGGYYYGRTYVAWLDRCTPDPTEEVGVFN